MRRSFTERYFDALAAAPAPTLRVAGVIQRDGFVLAQFPTDAKGGFFAFPGGRYEPGDSFGSRLEAEIREETTAQLTRSRYGFVVESRIPWVDRAGADVLAHLVEHFLFAEIDREAVQSREPHLSFHWLEIATLQERDLRPHVVRDALAEGRAEELRHVAV